MMLLEETFQAVRIRCRELVSDRELPVLRGSKISVFERFDGGQHSVIGFVGIFLSAH
jgi:hypothetical protein